jgi:hypothetical protein
MQRTKKTLGMWKRMMTYGVIFLVEVLAFCLTWAGACGASGCNFTGTDPQIQAALSSLILSSMGMGVTAVVGVFF